MIIIKSENWLLAEAMERMLETHPDFNGGLGRIRADDLWEKVIKARGEDPRVNAPPISAEQLAFDVARLHDINEMFADRRNR